AAVNPVRRRAGVSSSDEFPRAARVGEAALDLVEQRFPVRAFVDLLELVDERAGQGDVADLPESVLLDRAEDDLRRLAAVRAADQQRVLRFVEVGDELGRARRRQPTI